MASNLVTKSGKAARSTCTQCHMIYDRKDMRQLTTTENTGHSHGGGVSMGRRRKLKNGRYTRDTRTSVSHRRYYRKKKYWVCNNCLTENAKAERARARALEASYGPIYKFFRSIFRFIGEVSVFILGIAVIWLVVAVPTWLVFGVAAGMFDAPILETISEAPLYAFANMLDNGMNFSEYEGGWLMNLGGFFGPFVVVILYSIISDGDWKKV